MKHAYCLFFMILFALDLIASPSEDYRFETIASDLEHPWSLAVVSESEYLVTERVGRLRRIIDGQLDSKAIQGVPKVLFKTQGGLSDVILHPNFSENRYIYLSFSETKLGTPNLNTLKIIRGRYVDGSLNDIVTIFSAKPFRKAAAHYGARMLFLNDGTLLITSGDAFNPREKAQTLDNHFGKVIRVNDDGSVPDNNPFVGQEDALPEIWSYGHRNMQGLALGNRGKIIFEHEHGPKGGDELNILKSGLNYGWPAITYGIDYSGAMISPFTERAGMEQPIKYWVPSIAPSGMVFYDKDMFPAWKGSLFLTALVPGDVRRLSISDGKVIGEEILFEHLGRLRHITVALDGSLLVATDGPKGQIIRVSASDASDKNLGSRE